MNIIVQTSKNPPEGSGRTYQAVKACEVIAKIYDLDFEKEDICFTIELVVHRMGNRDGRVILFDN